ncbi:MAG: hypothetical protein HY851_04260, partial [candidate division Zixibacteria bacterium]|nr:hypothetical protein [candidate division Zixibacteria bacterium]
MKIITTSYGASMTARLLPLVFASCLVLWFAPSAVAQVDSAGTSPTSTVTSSPDSALYPPSPERLANLTAYSRLVNIWRFAEFFISVAVLLIVLFTGLSARLRDLASTVKQSFFRLWLYFALVMIAIYILGWPANYYRGFVVENQYGFMNQTFMQWWGEDLLGLFVSLMIGIIPVWFLYAALNRFRRWWLVFSIGAIPFMIFFVVVAPVVISPLFNKFEPLADKALETRILALADKAGIPG